MKSHTSIFLVVIRFLSLSIFLLYGAQDSSKIPPLRLLLGTARICVPSNMLSTSSISKADINVTKPALRVLYARKLATMSKTFNLPEADHQLVPQAKLAYHRSLHGILE